MTQAQLADKLTVANSVALSFVEAGKVLPTKPDLETICLALNVEPTDIYAPADLNLLGTRTMVKGVGKRDHGENLTEFRAWVTRDLKREIEDAVALLGYKSLTDWFRAATATLLKDAKAGRTA